MSIISVHGVGEYWLEPKRAWQMQTSKWAEKEFRWRNTLLTRQAGCAARRHFVSAGGALWAPGVTLINYKGDNISKYVYPTVIIDIARKIAKFRYIIMAS